MNTRAPARLIAALSAATLLLSGCGSDFRLALPRIVVEIDSEGYPSVIGISGRAFGAQVLAPSLVQQISQSNLQHVELAWRPEGVFIWANAKPLTALTLNEQSFRVVSELVKRFGVANPSEDPIAGLGLWLARVLQLNVVLKFPLQPNAAEIPLRDERAPLPTGGSAAAPASIVGLKLSFDENGVPAFLGVSFTELQQLAGVDLSATFLPRETVQQLVAAGVQHITIRTTPEGIKLWVNADQVTTLIWSEEMLSNTAETVGNLRLLDPAVATVVKQFVPLVNQLDANIVLRFPTGGAAPIPEPN